MTTSRAVLIHRECASVPCRQSRESSEKFLLASVPDGWYFTEPTVTRPTATAPTDIENSSPTDGSRQKKTTKQRHCLIETLRSLTCYRSCPSEQTVTERCRQPRISSSL
ncbi:hypothetical protein Bbelb_193830 [Branchiostoma belcheri]|nr:hypothetical protein Bbelb_193830 [Branchiostoma belcheri]